MDNSNNCCLAVPAMLYSSFTLTQQASEACFTTKLSGTAALCRSCDPGLHAFVGIVCSSAYEASVPSEVHLTEAGQQYRNHHINTQKTHCVCTTPYHHCLQH